MMSFNNCGGSFNRVESRFSYECSNRFEGHDAWQQETLRILRVLRLSQDKRHEIEQLLIWRIQISFASLPQAFWQAFLSF